MKKKREETTMEFGSSIAELLYIYMKQLDGASAMKVFAVVSAM